MCYTQKHTASGERPENQLRLLDASRWLLLVGLALATVMSSNSKIQNGAEKSQGASATRMRESEHAAWAESTLRKLSVDEKIGQLLFATYHGSFTAEDSFAYRQMMHDVEDLHVGGFINVTQIGPLGIIKSQAYPTAVLNNQLQAKAKLPLLIGADFERGTAMRLDEGTSFPTAMAVAAAGDPRDAYTMGAVTAREARAVGIHWIYAPDADVNNNPGNPIINTRSFGENPERVAEFVAEFVRGVQENGGLATAKHFPGHGDTAADSHIDLPVIQASRERLENLELLPFRAAIEAGVGSVMTGHLSVPAMEPDANTPATLSFNVLTGVLRKEMGFDGLVVTDAMDMGGITTRFAPGEAAVRAVLAGADALLMPPVPDAAFLALQEAVATGRISRERLDASVRRILLAKARVGLGIEKNKLVDLNAVNATLGTAAAQNQAQNISDRGVTLLRNTAGRLPLDGTKPLRALLVAMYADPETYPGEDLERELRARCDSVVTLRADTKFIKADSLKLPAADTYDVAILALFVRVSDRKGNVDVPAEQMVVAQNLFKSGKPVVTLGLGSPYLIESFPQAETWISAFGISDVAQISLARAMFGEIAVRGTLPVSVAGIKMNAGTGLELAAEPMTFGAMDVRKEAQLQPAFDVIERAIAEKAFPGATLAIGYRGKVSLHAFGKLSYEAGAKSVVVGSVYDIASLTKAVATTTLAAKLVEGDFAAGLDLDAKVSRYLPEWLGADDTDGGLNKLFRENPRDREWREKVTVRNLLTHTSGLPAFKEYWRHSRSKQETLRAIFAEPLEYEPGTKEIYSDLGIILVGEIIERLTGKPLDELARAYVFGPLGMKSTGYRPEEKMRDAIAPTEFDEALRKRAVQGEVHDENAFAMGGVAGHAGLFSTAADLAAFCQMMLNGGVYGHRRILKRATVGMFTTPQAVAGGARTLGWMVPTAGGSSGQYFSGRSYGHLGFTGTSMWVDPEKELFVVLLTNRVNPTRENVQIQKVRPALHDAVVQALGLSGGGAARQ